MIQLGTRLNVADNTGVKLVECIQVLGSSKRRYARLGDVIVASVKKAEPRKEIKKHDVVRVLIVRQKKEYRREDGSYIRFDDNACVILDEKSKRPKGGRIIGPVAREVRQKGFEEVASSAQELV